MTHKKINKKQGFKEKESINIRDNQLVYMYICIELV